LAAADGNRLTPRALNWLSENCASEQSGKLLSLNQMAHIREIPDPGPSLAGSKDDFPAVRSKQGVMTMCDYSLHLVKSRPARVGDKLVSTQFANSLTRGFAALGEPDVAVCLQPGTELAFERDVECDSAFPFLRRRKLHQKVARFRQIHRPILNSHHDALEFPDGQIAMVTDLREGQHATVLQLPASVRPPHKAESTSPIAAATTT
jgi:hypothetical protein